MKKSSRDRRVFRRLQRRSMPYQLRTEYLISLMADTTANTARFAAINLGKMREVVRAISTTHIDTVKIQEALSKIKQACDNLSKVKINISIY